MSPSLLFHLDLGHLCKGTMYILRLQFILEVMPNYVVWKMKTFFCMLQGSYMINANPSHFYNDSDGSRASSCFKKWRQGWARETAVTTLHYYLIWNSIMTWNAYCFSCMLNNHRLGPKSSNHFFPLSWQLTRKYTMSQILLLHSR